MSEWISVKERLPEIIGYYLVYGNFKIKWAFFNSAENWCGTNEYYTLVTHWMYLPSPPEEEC